MRKWVLVLSCLVICAQAQDDGSIPLPEWTDEDWALLQSGEIEPGSSLLGELARKELFADIETPLEIDEALVIEEVPEPEEIWPTTVAPEFLAAYFEKKPESYLIDPQKLLTMQEVRDREGFLEYHAQDSEITLFLYIFDAQQSLPDGESAQTLLNHHFADEKRVAVVTYFMGMPERSAIAFSSELESLVDDVSRARALDLAVEEALLKSDPTSQLESFSIQLSIRLYWLEREIEQRILATDQTELAPAEASASVVDAAPEGTISRLLGSKVTFYTVVSSFSVTTVILLGWLGRRFSEKRRKYYFPEVEEELLLGAPHAAGVGGVIFYHSSNVPPSMQRDEVPDYLDKL